ncbi:nucleotidyltransferase family protein [Asaia krungthepensis]|uniref:MobA-related protein n=1 Tax=Asaia krungthepensis NRIC 0535 TaxID=1307925 RepID=A0ABQ0PVC1_9PROT|nr:NTP transferase domain-containing protein [Asaia krungthepensis]GBQ82547.1 putative MobA-related protein [Asaia krungthepensis NRIC 0535]
MTCLPDMILLVLGGGLSRRFGAEDKLETRIGSLPLAHHILSAVDHFPWHQKRAVCRTVGNWHAAYVAQGFELLVNPLPERGLGSSLALGTNGLSASARVFVCLADMPFVSHTHILALRQASDSVPDQIIASCAPNYRGPPAIFPVSSLSALDPNSDHGARPLLRLARLIPAPAEELIDIDYAGDVTAANAQFLQQARPGERR